MSEIFKVGIDIHGVIDTFPKRFMQLSMALVASGAEVHIVTGSKRDEHIDTLLNNAGITFTHYFSIVEFLEKNGDIRWEDDQPYALDEKWDMAKRNYCELQCIDLMIDDSPVYRDTFADIGTNFLHLTS